MLRIFAHATRRAADVAARGAVFLDDCPTLNELVEAVGARALPGRRPLDRLAGRRLLREVLRRDPRVAGPFESIATTRGMVAALARALATLAEGDVAPAELAWTALRVQEPSSRARLQALVSLQGALAAEMEARGVADGPLLLGAAVHALETGAALPGGWRAAARAGATAIDVLDLSPARARLLRALGAQRSLPHDPDRAAAFAFLGALDEGVRTYDPVPSEAEPGLVAVLRRVFASRERSDPGPAQEPGAALRATASARSSDEPHDVAARVRALLEDGAAPDAIAVALPGLDEHADAVRAALERYGVPCSERRGPSLSSAPPATWLLDALRAARARFPRDQLVRLCASRYVDVPRDDAGRDLRRLVPALLRGAGARDDRAGGGYEASFAAQVARVGAKDPRHGAQLAAVAAHVGAALARLRPLADSGPARARVRALREAFEGLGVARRASIPWGRRLPEDLHGVGPDERRLARDQRAVETAGEILDAIAADLGDVAIAAHDLAAHVEDAFASTTLPSSGFRGGAVSIMDLRELGGSAFDHVIVAGLEDGRFPARGGADAVLPDADRLLVNRALGRKALRPDHRPADPVDRKNAPPAREELDPLVFLLGLCAARRSVDLFWARTDQNGRALVRSPFVDAVLSAHPRGTALVEALPVAPIPPAARAWRAEELRARLLLEGGRTADGSPAPDGTDLAMARAAIERGREDFFLGRRVTPEVAAYSGALDAAGRVGGGSLEPLLRAHTADGPDAPGWSASRIEAYAACGFRYFGERLLRLRPEQEHADDLDALDRGALVHRVLEVVMRALAAGGLLPLTAGGAPAARAQALAHAATTRTLDAWETSRFTGHPALWRLRRDEVLDTVERFLHYETERPTFGAAGLAPWGFEVIFGPRLEDDDDRLAPEPLAALPLASPDGSEAIHLRGRIDRIDRDAAGAASGVIDYKSSAHYEINKRVVAGAAATNEFQLPVYLAVAAREGWGPPRALHAVYLSLREMKPTRDFADVLDAAALEALVELQPERRAAIRAGKYPDGAPGPANLADAVWAFVERMRAGDFAVRPRSCAFCTVASACRVQLHQGQEPSSP